MASEVMEVDYRAVATEWLESTGNLKKFNEGEKRQFLDICCAYGLNPIKREVYGIKYGENFNIIVGYEVYLKRAERSGKLDGYDIAFEGTGDDLRAILTVYRKDWGKPFRHTVWLREYDQKNSMWKSKPYTMLGKVAISQGFRRCFPDELGGMPYTEDEVGLVDVTPSSTEAAKKGNGDRMKALIESVYDDGTAMFTEDDKAFYREMYRKDGAEKTMAAIQAKIGQLQAEVGEM